MKITFNEDELGDSAEMEDEPIDGPIDDAWREAILKLLEESE